MKQRNPRKLDKQLTREARRIMRRNPSQRKRRQKRYSGFVLEDNAGGRGWVTSGKAAGSPYQAVYRSKRGSMATRTFDKLADAKRWIRREVDETDYQLELNERAKYAERQRMVGKRYPAPHQRKQLPQPGLPRPRAWRNPSLKGIGNWSAGDWLAVGIFGAVVYGLSRTAR